MVGHDPHFWGLLLAHVGSFVDRRAGLSPPVAASFRDGGYSVPDVVFAVRLEYHDDDDGEKNHAGNRHANLNSHQDPF